MRGKRVFITGGATGLGRAIALRFAREGARVAIGDINADRGEATRIELSAAADACFLGCDVRSESDLKAAAEAIDARWGGLDILVNNAGVALAGGIEQVPMDDWAWIIDINLLGVVRGCRVFTPLLQRQGGHIVNIASLAGLVNAPGMSAYSGSKAAVISVSETLQVELAPFNIGVSVVCPSFFKTNLGESFRTTDEKYRAVMNKLSERSAVTADDVAEDVIRAVRDRRFYVLPHAEGRKIFLLKRLLPRKTFAALMIRRARAFGRKRPSS